MTQLRYACIMEAGLAMMSERSNRSNTSCHRCLHCRPDALQMLMNLSPANKGGQHCQLVVRANKREASKQSQQQADKQAPDQVGT